MTTKIIMMRMKTMMRKTMNERRWWRWRWNDSDDDDNRREKNDDDDDDDDDNEEEEGDEKDHCYCHHYIDNNASGFDFVLAYN